MHSNATRKKQNTLSQPEPHCLYCSFPHGITIARSSAVVLIDGSDSNCFCLHTDIFISYASWQ